MMKSGMKRKIHPQQKASRLFPRFEYHFLCTQYPRPMDLMTTGVLVPFRHSRLYNQQEKWPESKLSRILNEHRTFKVPNSHLCIDYPTAVYVSTNITSKMSIYRVYGSQRDINHIRSVNQSSATCKLADSRAFIL